MYRKKYIEVLVIYYMEHINKKTEKYKIYSVVYIREDGQEFVDYIAADKIGNAFKLIKMFKVNVNFSSFNLFDTDKLCLYFSISNGVLTFDFL